MPTAVMTEFQREHDVEQGDLNDGGGEGKHRALAGAVMAALDRMVDLHGRLDQEEDAAAAQDDVAPGELIAPKVGDGVTRPATHEIENSRARRVSKARARPHFLALSCSSGLQREATICTNIRLSMPSTISSAAKVRNAAKASAVNISANWNSAIWISPRFDLWASIHGQPVKVPTAGCRRHIGKGVSFRQPGRAEFPADEFAATRELICQSRRNPGILAFQHSSSQPFRTIP